MAKYKQSHWANHQAWWYLMPPRIIHRNYHCLVSNDQLNLTKNVHRLFRAYNWIYFLVVVVDSQLKWLEAFHTRSMSTTTTIILLSQECARFVKFQTSSVRKTWVSSAKMSARLPLHPSVSSSSKRFKGRRPPKQIRYSSSYMYTAEYVKEIQTK